MDQPMHERSRRKDYLCPHCYAPLPAAVSGCPRCHRRLPFSEKQLDAIRRLFDVGFVTRIAVNDEIKWVGPRYFRGIGDQEAEAAIDFLLMLGPIREVSFCWSRITDQSLPAISRLQDVKGNQNYSH